MATESPMRIVESSGGRKWASSRDSATFASSFSNMAADELGLLLEGHKIYGNPINTVPNRSGSAPPSIEGSLAAFGDLFTQQSSTAGSSLSSLNTVMENYQSQSEEELRASPSYLAFYFSNLNLNPRLPPPIISRENKHLIRQNGGVGNNWRSISLDDSGGGTLHLQKYPLSTHNEEPEEEKLPLQTSDHAEGSPSNVTPETNITSLAGRHKSLVDLIQEDFPRTPSPVYTQSRSPSHATTDEQNDHDIHAIPLEDCSVDSSKSQRSGEGSVNAHVEPQTLVPNASGPTATLAANAEVPSQRGVVRKDVNMGNKILLHVTPELDTSRISIPVDDSRNFEQNQYLEKNLQQQQQYNPYPDRNAAYQFYRSLPQVVAQSQGGNHVQPGMEQILHAPSIFPSVEIPPVMQPRGPVPPLYATAAGFSGTPFYPSLSPTGMYAPQYGVGGYPMNSSGLTHYIAGYPSHAMPVHFDATSGQNFNSLTSGVATGDVQHLGGLQHLNKFYGQHGSLVQPSFLDPFQVQYFQHLVEDPYAVSGQYGRLPSTGIMMGQVDFFDSPKESNVAAYMGDQNFQTPPNNTVTIGNQRKGGMPSSYYGTPPTIGVMSHFSASPLGSPLLPGSPVGGANHFGRRSEIRFPQSSFRDVGGSSGWQGQRGADTFNDAKKHSFLEELKSSNARKFELSDIAGRIVEFSVDQHGSRFIQQKLENSCAEDKASVFKEVFPHASKLMTDVFGNYVIQKFFEHGSHEQRRELADQLRGQMLNLSLQMYGCRVIQKALEVIDLDQKTQLVHELDGHVMKCVRDQNGNHVIQKCIECLPTENIGFVISSFRGQVSTLSTHPYGCRVIQRVLEHCGDESQSQCIVDEILESAYVLAQDQYGNYVTQHVLERGRPQERSRIISKLTGNVVQLSQHKYASNVVEKCLEYGDSSERELLIEEILGHSEEADNLLIMMKDQFANYVVQKILEISNDRQRETLLSRIGVHLNALKKYTYGKHIVARFEQLSGEDSTLLEPLT